MYGSLPPPAAPAGSFMLPVCVPNADAMREIMSAIDLYRVLVNQGEYTPAFNALVDATYNLTPCNPTAQPACYVYPALSSIVSYVPFDPRRPDESSYNASYWADQPLRIIGGGLNLPGTQTGDVVTTFDQLVFNNTALVTRGFPTAVINLPAGTQSVELALVEMPQGGQAVLWFDDDLLSADVVRTTSGNVVDFPSLNEILEFVLDGELATERRYERTVPPGAQQLKVLFAPTFGGNELIGYGGGLREIELCGVITPEVEAPDLLRVNPNDACQIQQSTDGGATWTNVFRLDACQIEGPAGPQGATGPAGPQGATGPAGPQGAPAPIPAISTNQLLGGEGTTVSFDLDGDGQFDDGGFTVFNGADGADGATGPQGPPGVSPVVTLDDTAFGVNILVDNDADGTPDQAATVFDGLSGGLPEPATVDSLCGASYKIANELIEKITTELQRDFTTYTGPGDYLEQLLSGGGPGYWLLTAADDFADYIQNTLSPTERSTANTELLAFMDELAEMFYCADLDRGGVGAAIDADTTLSAFSRNTLRSYYDAVNDGQVAIWAVVGYRDTTNDCGAFNCAPSGTSVSFDFLTSDGGWIPRNAWAAWIAGVGWEQRGSFGAQIYLSPAPAGTFTEIRIYPGAGNYNEIDFFQFNGGPSEIGKLADTGQGYWSYTDPSGFSFVEDVLLDVDRSDGAAIIERVEFII